LALTAPAVAQSPPLHQRELIDETSIYGECGFPVTVHLFADVRYTVFFDDQGNVNRVIMSVSRAETTLSANGVVLRSAGAGATITEFEPEGGAESAATHGLTANFVVPEVGPVWLEAGRIVYLFDPRRAVFVAGVGSFDGQALCAALAG